MKKAKIVLSKDFEIAQVDDRLFGSFVEHMGSVIYNGIYEPDHPSADKHGFRTDVLALVKELGLSVVRYPGGNFSSGYNWEDGIGPKENRPVKLDIAWQAIESNQFGLDEFMTWRENVGADPIMTVNLGTRGVDAARNMIEYCNFPGGTYWSDLRKEHGIAQPYNIKTWCLGNELDGDWQIAQKTARDYGLLARETAKAMKWVDPDIELVAAGSSAPHMPTYPDWDKTVLHHTYDHADYLSLHHYIDKGENDTASYLAMPMEMDQQIRDIIAACDYIRSEKRSKKTMYLSFDEWNVWRKADVAYQKWQNGSPFDWVRFRMEDALVFGSAMFTLLRHADRIKIACQSLLLNTIPLILTEKQGRAWRNPTYYPFAHMSRYGRGKVLQNVTESPKYDTSVYTDVETVDSVAVWNEEKEELTVFAINRGDEAILLDLDIRDFERYTLKHHIVMNHERLDAINTSHAPSEVAPQSRDHTTVDQGRATSKLEPYSWNVIHFHVKG